LAVDNYLSHKHAKKMFKCFVLCPAQKWQTCRSEYGYFQIYIFIRFCYFLCSPQYKDFVIKFCMLIGYIVELTMSFFIIFWNLKIGFLIFFKWRDHWSSGAKNTFRKKFIN
jgi:hypothetical protein